MRNYKVAVGNVGQVHSGTNEFRAVQLYDEYVALAKLPSGLPSGEEVVLSMDDRVLRVHAATK